MGKLKKALIKLLVDKRNERTSKLYEKKITTTTWDPGFPLNSEIVALHKQKWSRLSSKKIHLGWLQWYQQCSGVESPDFVPENIFYPIIEPILNDSRYDKAFVEKNFYDLMYPKGLFPEAVIRNIDGVYFDVNYQPIELNNANAILDILKGIDRVIVKPTTDSGGGRSVELFVLKNGKFVNSAEENLTIQNLSKSYKQNFIIQKVLQQHEFPSYFNKDSLNTFRVLTYRSPVTNIIHVLHVVFRFGSKGHFRDNSSAGGQSTGVSPDGKLNKFALKKNGSKPIIVNDINLAENEYTVPFLDEMKQMAKFIAERNIHHRLLSLDMVIDNQNNIRCVEVNNRGNELNFIQCNNGSFFGEFTDEVIAYCEKNMEKLYTEYII